MSEAPRTIHIHDLMKYSDDLIEFLKEERDMAGLKHFLEQSNALQLQCRKDFDQVQRSIEEYEKKIDACKQKKIAANSDAASDAELELLAKQLEEEQKLEQNLREELRIIVDEIEGLEQERGRIEEKRRAVKKSEGDELRAQRELSMCASVTNIIPCLDDPFKISGYIIDREKKVTENFEFDPSKTTSFATCDNIWKMINL